MSGLGRQIVTSVTMRLHEGVSIDLRGSLETTAFLSIDGDIEIILSESHVRALQNQAAAALGDMALIEAAETVLGDAYDAGAQAQTAASLARQKAEAAKTAGAVEQADQAYQAAQRATTAAEQAQVAVRAATDAMDVADRAAEDARAAAMQAAEAAGQTVSNVRAATALHVV